MARIKILGSAAVVTSSVKTEVINTLRKFKPTALKLVDKETKDELFSMAAGSAPSFTKFGVVFPSTNAEGLAQVTLQIPDSIEDAKKKDFVKDTYGYALLSLNKLEDQIADIMEDTAAEFAEINESIETL